MSAPDTDPQPASGEAATEFADKVFTAVLGTMETLSLYLGERLGWLDALVGGPITAAQLAERTQTAERYAVEWLEMQAVYGNLTVIDHGPGPREQRTFGLVPGASEVLTDRHSLSYLGALPRMFAAVGLRLDDLLAAYRTGGGVSWAELGADARESQALPTGPGSNPSSARRWRRYPTCTGCWRPPAPGSPTSAVVRAGRASRSPWRTRVRPLWAST
jgi:hypothetical protein